MKLSTRLVLVASASWRRARKLLSEELCSYVRDFISQDNITKTTLGAIEVGGAGCRHTTTSFSNTIGHKERYSCSCRKSFVLRRILSARILWTQHSVVQRAGIGLPPRQPVIPQAISCCRKSFVQCEICQLSLGTQDISTSSA